MQLLTNSSEEGTRPGLGWIDAETIRFQHGTLKIPHMGWNTVRKRADRRLIDSIADGESRFYFVHSYYVNCTHSENVLLTAHYGHEFHCCNPRRKHLWSAVSSRKEPCSRDVLHEKLCGSLGEFEYGVLPTLLEMRVRHNRESDYYIR